MQQPPQQPGPYQQPNQQPYYPYMPPTLPPERTRKKRRIWRYIIAGIAVIIILSICRAAITGNSSSTDTTSTPASTTSSTQLSKASPTTQPTPPVHYPPTTLADLHGLAAKGNAGAIHEFHSEAVGAAGVCPQPKREVTVSPSLTGQTLAEDLLTYFYAQHLDNTCGSIVFAYHSQSESGDVYTAGRVWFDVTDANGSPNLNPNSRLKYKLTLDIGSTIQNQEYVISY